MKISEFNRAVAAQFGEAYGRSLLRDLVLPGVGHRTGAEALASGVAPREVWLALCAEMDVPRNLWHGAGLPDPRR